MTPTFTIRMRLEPRTYHAEIEPAPDHEAAAQVLAEALEHLASRLRAYRNPAEIPASGWGPAN